MEQKDFGFGSLCRFLLSCLALDRALVMQTKKAQGIMVLALLQLGVTAMQRIHFNRGNFVFPEMETI